MNVTDGHIAGTDIYHRNAALRYVTRPKVQGPSVDVRKFR